MVRHQISQFQTKIGLLKALPATKLSAVKIREYSNQVRLRWQLADIYDGDKRSQEEIQVLFDKLRQSHLKNMISAADRIVEEQLMAAIVGNEHISKPAF